MRSRMLVLSTRKSTVEDENTARKMGFRLVSYPLLRFEYQLPGQKELEKLFKMQPDAWVFTSKNGVEGFIRIFEQGLIAHKPKMIFAVGEKTASRLKELSFDAVFPEAENGAALAKLISGYNIIQSALHFCGNLRRLELSELLRQHKIEINELVVYKTITEKPQNDFPKDIKAILFYSPSAVEAFGDAIEKFGDVPYVAVGSTTAGSLRKKNCRMVIAAEKSSTESMLKALKKHL